LFFDGSNAGEIKPNISLIIIGRELIYQISREI
jgi:hypothetical protein